MAFSLTLVVVKQTVQVAIHPSLCPNRMPNFDKEDKQFIFARAVQKVTETKTMGKLRYQPLLSTSFKLHGEGKNDTYLFSKFIEHVCYLQCLVTRMIFRIKGLVAASENDATLKANRIAHGF